MIIKVVHPKQLTSVVCSIYKVPHLLSVHSIIFLFSNLDGIANCLDIIP